MNSFRPALCALPAAATCSQATLETDLRTTLNRWESRNPRPDGGDGGQDGTAMKTSSVSLK